MASLRLRKFGEKLQVKGDEAQHEKTDSWSNRDLIPLPPSRRTWAAFHYFGYWAISSLNVSNWQTPNTYLTLGLSVGQSMAVIVISRALIALFSTLVAWCGLKWHIGFTIQNRYTWGMRGSYIPLLQRILLNFIWTAVQCWNGGRLVAVCITAIWPSFATIENTLPSNMPTTTYQFVGFIVFWTLSLPFLFIRPEKFKLPFQVVSAYCGIGMICMMIWSLSVAKGVGPVFSEGEKIPSESRWNSSWLIMSGINQMLGGIAAGITNGSDFSRYAKSPKHYILGSIASVWVVGTMVSFVGLVTTSACQKIYGEIYWNPPDLLMVMMDAGQGSSKARTGVFFLSAGFALTAMFENICGNAVAGGIDLAGLFPRYIDIRRGALITFIACWVVQPWQLINKAATFITVLSSFAVFLAPMIGVMCCDFFILRKQKIQLSNLYRTHDTAYWYFHGVNWRVIPAWLCGWGPTVGGLILTVRGNTTAPKRLFELYYMAFFFGFFTSALLFYVTMRLFPVPGMGDFDDVDYYGAFTAKEAAKLGVMPLDSLDVPLERVEHIERLKSGEKGPKTEYIVADGVY
ncbi:uracil permease [Mollisia scopiformis]|uniref:Uracil permease n=1 Tax=Mollisia scopiformis TaxID=149040 RepID=A0A194XAH7_MOLSC|nr:uracil permease [Mollisia scopiformis]KUJ17170.1 uracil permease [Mollisia scopiformis]